jgi:hypothetical protein
MITDANLTLSASQAVTATAFSTNTIDLGQNRDIGVGEELNIYINTEVAATAAGAATVNFQVVASDNANLSTPTILGQTDAIPKASIVVGAVFVLPIPVSALKNLGQRYLGIQYTVGTGPLTAGTFSAGVVIDVPVQNGVKKVNYPSGFSVK